MSLNITHYVMTNLSEQLLSKQLNQVKEELAQAKAHIGRLEAQLAKCQIAQDLALRSHGHQIGNSALYRYMSEYSWDIFALIDAQGKIQYVSPAVYRLTGYTADDYQQMTLNHYLHPDDIALTRHHFSNLMATPGLSYTFELRCRHKDGHWLWFEMTAVNHLNDADIRAIFVNSHDITERKKTQLALQSTADRYRLLADNIPDALFVLRLRPEGSPLEILEVNQSACHLLGYSREELLQRTLEEIDDPSSPTPKEAIAQRLLAGETVVFEQIHRTRCGAQIPVEIHATMGSVDGETVVISLARDIRRRQMAEEALRQSEIYLRSLVDSQTAFHIRVDMQGNVTYCNKRYQEQFGWIAPSLIGISALQTVLPADHHKVIEATEACIQQIGQPARVELRKPAQSGGHIWTLWEFIAVGGKEALVEEIQCVGFDITQQKRTEVELRASERRYRQMFELHGLPKLIVNPETGEIIDANPAAGRFYGCEVATLKTMTVFEINLSPIEEIQSKMAQAAAEDMLSCEFVHRGANGVMRNVEIFTGPIEMDGKHYLYSIITDTTEKQQAKAALESAYDLLEQRVQIRTAELEQVKNRLEAIFNHSGDGILLLDLHGTIQQANHTFDQLIGIAAGGTVGKKLSDFQVKMDVGIAAILKDVACTHQTRQIEAQVTNVDGTGLDVELSIASTGQTAEDPARLVCIVRDITERKQAEMMVAEERNLLRALIDAVPDFIYVKDVEHRMVLNNKAHARSLGFDTPMAALGKRDDELFPADLAAKYLADEEQIFQDETPIFAAEEQSISVEGKRIWALTTKIPLHNLKGELIGLVGITHDISQIKATEQALRHHEKQLRQSQKMLQLVLDTMPVAVFWKDLDSVYLGCNRLFAQDAGLDHAMEIIGEGDEAMPWLASEASSFRDYDRAVIESGQPLLAIEETLLTAKGKHRVIQTNKLPLRDEENRIIGVLGAYIDITARKEMEDALRANELKFRQFIESAPIATVIVDSQGFITLVNQQTEQLFGYRREELIGQLVECLVPDSVRTTHPTHRLNYVEQPTYRHKEAMELMARHKDGTVFPIDLQLSYIDMDPDPLVMVILTDITQRKAAEATLKAALAQEKELGDLKSRFVSMASHEFRTPLAAIMATAESLALYRHKMDDSQVNHRLDKIRHQVLHMKGVMEDVLQLARIQADRTKFEPTEGDLDEVCREIIEEFEIQKGNHNRIHYSCPTTPVVAHFDRQLMWQIVGNLLSNALKYSSSDKPVSMSVVKNHTSIVLQVSDQGIGIPEQDKKHLFKPFHRATNVGTISGTGLGLTITKQAIELHNAELVWESKEDVGTTFTITFPRQ